MHFAYSMRQSPLCGWNSDNVDMVRHETVRQNRQIIQGAPFIKQFKIEAIIRVGKENALSSVTSLGNVMGNAGNHYAGKTCHAPSILAGRPSVKKVGMVSRMALK